jgi:hypothetical protein
VGQSHLWLIQAQAVKYSTPTEGMASWWHDGGLEYSIDPQRISLGAFCSLDTNGCFGVDLPDGAPVVLRPSVDGEQHFVYSVSASGFQLTHACVAEMPTNTDRLTIGVCEEVELGGMPDGTKWTVSAGSLSQTNGNANTFTAPDVENTKVTVSAQAPNSPPQKLDFVVLKPSGAIWEYYPGALFGSNNPLSLSYVAWIYIQPDAVSFYNIKFAEGQTNAITTGYFIYDQGHPHVPGAPSLTLGVVPGKGTLCESYDVTGGTTQGAPYTNGTFTWHIPCYYITPRGTTNYFTTVDHLETLTASSTNKAVLTIEKHGSSGSWTN